MLTCEKVKEILKPSLLQKIRIEPFLPELIPVAPLYDKGGAFIGICKNEVFVSFGGKKRSECKYIFLSPNLEGSCIEEFLNKASGLISIASVCFGGDVGKEAFNSVRRLAKEINSRTFCQAKIINPEKAARFKPTSREGWNGVEDSWLLGHFGAFITGDLQRLAYEILDEMYGRGYEVKGGFDALAGELERLFKER